jgi:DtxR family manganese transport transcriptional regulator
MAEPQQKNASARRHSRVRRQHSDELAQDYVEAIYKRLQAGESPRVTDLQADFGVSHVSVIRALQRLDDQKLVHYSKETGVDLTRRGRQVARQAAERHALLVRFLSALGVSSQQADADAEGAEHHLSEETFNAIRAFLERDEA